MEPEKEVKVEQVKTSGKRDDTIYIGGNKPFMVYVTGVVGQFTMQNMNEVVIKARGKFINRAVDVAEVARKRFLYNDKISVNVLIDSDNLKNEDGEDVRLSTIEITLKRG